ncbi:60S ribosomal protein L2, mitochondrial precursor [Amniculicola lignicola CBS 123094]|uniref:Large ribosomal subunit protein bL27m n=1 Tax=Amniculicola lignicola CBS 123094 TaxID=1392246 RepID=A0A6A5W7G5_9PLEO|nr:60S ribosomal protein L2, mitochondrial precursor [Amniculicola lignicola CBS 123094]
MLLPRIIAPVRVSIKQISALSAPSSRVLDAVRAANGTITTPTLSFLRHASHQSQGRANGAKDGPGKRLGAKKTGGEYVIPGNIIFRQRGTAWFPGENCAFGRDHCVYAMQPGYVRYYRDPLKHPNRQYIGVCLQKDDKLPYPPNAIRRRRLGMELVKREPEAPAPVALAVGADEGGEGTPKSSTTKLLTMGRGYAYREANWQIGRAAERAGVSVLPFVPGDRFLAWRKSNARKALNVEKKKLRNAQKSTKPKAKKR